MIIRYFAIPLLGALLVLASCKTEEVHQTGATPPSQAMAPTLNEATAAPASAPAADAPQQPKPDPVPELIGSVEKEYQRGEANYRAGHLESARENFDRAFDMLLSGPVTVHADERLEREFDKLVENVNRLEMQALKEGDGFTAMRSEPAPIDEANEVTFPVDPAVRAKAEAELRQTRSDLPLIMNDQVASFINYFSAGRGRGTLERALARSGRYRDMISRVLREEGVPQDLIYLAQAESGFHPLALSRAGARGMWQFMASRGEGYGLARNWWVDERQDPEKATRAAARHLRDLYNQFGDWYLAMAAYNSGPGTVQRAVERTGYADFWELYRRNVLPGETRNYVPIILAVTIVAKNPTQYGLDRVVPEVAPPMETVKVNYAVDLRLVAECVDRPVSLLQELNPSLLRMTTPKDAEFALHVPAGTGDQFLAAIAAIPLEMRTQWRYHRVEAGETLSQVAQRYRTTTRAIAEVNNLEPDAVLAKDAKLIIPVSASRRVQQPEGLAAGSSSDGQTRYSKHATVHVVRRGETMLSVADRYGVPVEQLRRWNHVHGNQLHAGQRLQIYKPLPSSVIRQGPSEERASAGKKGDKSGKKGAKNEKAESAKTAKGAKGKTQTAERATPATRTGKAASAKAEKTSAAKQRTHRVKRGETLASIASEYKTSVAVLKRENGNVNSLRPGQVLVIK